MQKINDDIKEWNETNENTQKGQRSCVRTYGLPKDGVVEMENGNTILSIRGGELGSHFSRFLCPASRVVLHKVGRSQTYSVDC